MPQVSQNPDMDEYYNLQLAMAIAWIICVLNKRVTIDGTNFGQQYILQKGLKYLVNVDPKQQLKIDQLLKHICFLPTDILKLTPEEKHKAMEALIFY